MTTTISADNGSISGSAGLKMTSDSSGVLALQTGANTTAVTVDASGRLQLGTTSAISSGTMTIASSGATDNQLALADTRSYAAGVGGDLVFSGKYNSAGNYTSLALIAGFKENATDGNNAGVLAFYTPSNGGGTTERVRIDSSGNLGLGVTPSAWSGSYKAIQLGGGTSIWSGASGNQASFYSNNLYFNGTNRLYLQNGYATEYVQSTSGTHSWYTAASGTAGGTVSLTQAMTLDASGNLLVGATSQFNSGLVCIQSDNSVKNPIAIKNTGTTYGAGYHLILFANSSGAQAGAIDQTAVTTVNYNTASDARLKEDKGIATDTSVIDNIIVHDFVWKADGRVDKGVFAQEAYEVKPSAISVGKDDLTEDGSLETPWSVDYSKFVPDLIVYAQQLKKTVEAQAEKIDKLTARITALENK